ncbi:N-acyl homoserine lactonase family protein [Aquimarina sp. W85]|uniref:N-acyl homoserine lactonase family protein n=1 Tax=Aquimarina rhodophyticola TaxID=3342246 RepID=UPI00366D558F
MKHIGIVILFIFSLVSCKNFEKPETNVENTEVKDSIQSPEVRLYTFNGGTIQVNAKNLFAQGDTYKGDTITLADAFYVIKHPKGNLIWDTGLSEDLVGNNPKEINGGALVLSRKDSLLAQLDLIGMTPKDFDFIAFSHIHFDHTGAANYFKNATWLIQDVEYSFAQSEEIKAQGFYNSNDFKELTHVKQLQGDYDVFGDGSVVIKSYPGHTPGHQALFLNLANNGPTVLSGDLYHFVKNRENKIVPQFNYDIPETEKSIKAFEEFVKNNNAKVFIQHDPVHFDKMPISPKFIN